MTFARTADFADAVTVSIGSDALLAVPSSAAAWSSTTIIDVSMRCLPVAILTASYIATCSVTTPTAGTSLIASSIRMIEKSFTPTAIVAHAGLRLIVP
jgi:hypothetical protein